MRVARLDAGTADITMSPVNMSALLNAIQEKFTPQSQKAGVEVKVEAAANLPNLTADGDRLAQVFTNLVDNALKFTPRGGVITIRANVLDSRKEMLISGTNDMLRPTLFSEGNRMNFLKRVSKNYLLEKF